VDPHGHREAAGARPSGVAVAGKTVCQPLATVRLEVAIAELLTRRRLSLALAESCTGGLIAYRVTDVPGSSVFFAGGVVAYANHAKARVLGVPVQVLAEHGNVSPQAALAMAQGARLLLQADVALAATGIAGPGGGSVDMPVGLVFLHLSTPDGDWGERHQWAGSRDQNRAQSAEAALLLLWRWLHLPQGSLDAACTPECPRTDGQSLGRQSMTLWKLVDEPVTVQARFDPEGRVHPVAFVWRDRTCHIADRGRQWLDETGEKPVRCFLVRTACGDTFELHLELSALRWILHRAWIQPSAA